MAKPQFRFMLGSVSILMKAIERIAPDVGWQPISFVNAYFVGHSGGPWALIDSGVPGWAAQIFEASEASFGAGSRPEAIYLTHGHFDHAGSAAELAESWNVPIFAHRMELPYLTGRSDYPPPDPTIGGAMAFLSRFMPYRPRDLGDRVRELPGRASRIAGLGMDRDARTFARATFRFFRASDRVLIAGDAFATMNMDSWTGLVSGRKEAGARRRTFHHGLGGHAESIEKLADLRPNLLGCGHGIPMRKRVAGSTKNLPSAFGARVMDAMSPRRRW